MNYKKERVQSAFFLPTDVLLLCNDLTSLPYLYDETVVDCITARYNEDLIYTWAGPVIVAVNPFKTLAYFYSEDKIHKLHNLLMSGQDHQDPHVFAVAGLAHRRLTSEIGLVNQAILVSGESGSGKTESAKFILTYLTQVESKMSSSPLKGVWKGQNPKDIQNKILASNPILEAFGNAATMRNHNSSRFGKLIRLQYNGSSLKGAMMDTYLLEKTRVTTQPLHERNFHIFYQLISGFREGLVPELDLKNESFYNITPVNHGRDSTQDLERFKDTLKAFEEIGISSGEQKKIFLVVAAILYLGNISFDLNAELETWTMSSSEVSKEAISTASRLLSLPVSTLEEAFTIKKITVISGQKTKVFSSPCEREDQCIARRDSFMQLLYASIFSYLVITINDKTSVDSLPWSSQLGILDVYGFEAFDENSLEQLCINYTNERLQQEFTRRYIASEHKLLIEEGFIDFPFVYSDRTKCVNALDSSVSVFAILNEECQLRRAINEEMACERVCNALQDTGIVLPVSSPRKQSGFLIKHYAGNVNYSSSGLLQKNRDEVPQDILRLLYESGSEFVRNLPCGMESLEESSTNDKQNKKGKRKITTLSKFKSSLDSLVKILTNCDLHYVRCLKPNSSCVEGSPDKPFLLDQLKTNGILETVKISQAGYPVRVLYSDFVKRYDFQYLNGYTSEEVTFMVLVNVVGTDSSGSPPEEKCRFGKNRIFLSESCLHALEEMRNRQKYRSATCIQKYYRKYKARQLYRKTVQAVVTLQRAVACWLCRRHFLELKRASICIQKTFRGFVQKRKYERTLQSLRIIQKNWKGWVYRKRFLLYLKTINTSAGLLRSSSRISFSGSSCYGSFAPASLTDHSVSDLETAITGESTKTGRLLFETEESGLETDTESLSGELYNKTGRASRLKSRHHYLNDLYRTSAAKCSEDEDLVNSRARDVHRKEVSLKSPTLSAKSTNSIYRRHLKQAKCSSSESTKMVTGTRAIEENTKGELKQTKHDPFRLLREFVEIQRTASDEGPFFLFYRDVHLYYKNGILSYRRLPIGRIKFHTRATCIPFSTSLPIHERPRGLIDAIR